MRNKKLYSDDELSLMAEIASLYYNDNLSQQEIADKFYFSRTKITRMLQKALECGVVQIKINIPTVRVRTLESQLCSEFDLKEAIVLKDYNVNKETMLTNLCEIAAQYIDDSMFDNIKIGVSWGTTIHKFAEVLKPKRQVNSTFIQLVGLIENGRNYDSSEILRILAAKYNSKLIPLAAPLYVESTQVADYLLQEPMIKNSLNLIDELDMVITGISDLNVNSKSRWEEHLSKEEKTKLLSQNIVGSLLARFIDSKGNVPSSEINDRTIGIELKQLKKIKKVICIATGEKKAEALVAAMSSKMVNQIIVDERLAKRILEIKK